MTVLYQNFNFLQSNFLMTFVLVVSYSWNVLSMEKWNNDWDKSSTVDIYDDRKYLRNPKWVTKAWTVSHFKFWGDHPPLFLPSLRPWAPIYPYSESFMSHHAGRCFALSFLHELPAITFEFHSTSGYDAKLKHRIYIRKITCSLF